MKKFVLVFIFVLSFLFRMNSVSAVEPVKVYLFYRETCPYCAALKAFLENEIGTDYKEKFDLIKIDVETDSNNKQKMRDVANFLDKNTEGAIPFMIIGEKSYIGFGSTESEKTDIKTSINNEYVNTDRYDIMEQLDSAPFKETKSSEDSDTITLVIMGVLLGAFGLVFFTKSKK